MTSPTAARLEVPADVLAAMVEHCRREAPIEACGLLAGVGDRAESCHPLRNVAASETRYTADIDEFIEVKRGLDEARRDILAFYHSHPRWRAVPSRTDLKDNYWGATPRIIVSLLDDRPDVRAWRLGPDSYEEIPLHVIGPDAP